MTDTSINTPAVSEAEALQVVSRGVSREIRTESQRTLGYCSDACKLQGHNVRKLAQKLEIRAEEKGETFNADSYMSNISNANGIMGLFGFDIESFKAWLDESPTKSLSAIYKAFRTLFVEPKPTKEKANKPEDEVLGYNNDLTPFELMMKLLPELTPEEREQVVEAIVALETPSEVVAEAA